MAKITPKSHQNHTKITPKSHQIYTKFTPKPHQNHTKITPKSQHRIRITNKQQADNKITTTNNNIKVQA